MACDESTAAVQLPREATGDAPLVDVILVNFNRVQLTSRCIEALQRQDFPRLRINVVDNGSTDGSSEVLRGRFQTVRIIESNRNLGFAAGCNLGLRLSLADRVPFVWLLNNDTEPAPSALSHLVRKLENDSVLGAVGSVLVSKSDQSVQAWGGGTVNLHTGVCRETETPPPPCTMYLTGASLLIRSQTLRDVGLFDEAFFLYWEDVDLCLRIKQKGWGLAVAEESIVVHHQGATAGHLKPWSDEQFVLASWKFFRRHTRVALVPFLSGALVRACARARHGRWLNVASICRAVARSVLSERG